MRASQQHRHVMMIGSPGTGKSMLAKAMSQLLPKESLQDVLVYHNPDDSNEPKVRTVPAGKGEQIVEAHKEEARKRNQMRSFLMWIILAVIIGYSFLVVQQPLIGILAAGIIYFAFRYSSRGGDAMVPKLLINNADRQTAPFEDATGAHGAPCSATCATTRSSPAAWRPRPTSASRRAPSTSPTRACCSSTR